MIHTWRVEGLIIRTEEAKVRVLLGPASFEHIVVAAEAAAKLRSDEIEDVLDITEKLEAQSVGEADTDSTPLPAASMMRLVANALAMFNRPDLEPHQLLGIEPHAGDAEADEAYRSMVHSFRLKTQHDDPEVRELAEELHERLKETVALFKEPEVSEITDSLLSGEELDATGQ